MIYSVIIYRNTKLVHHETLSRTRADDSNLLSFSPKSSNDLDHTYHLIMGMLSAVGGIVGLLSGGSQESRFETLLTAEYRLDYYDTISGYKFVVLSDPLTVLDEAAVRSDFERLYSLFFVPLVIRNPLFDPSRVSGNLNDSSCHVFVSELRNHFQSFNPPATLAPPSILGRSPSSVQLSLMVGHGSLI